MKTKKYILIATSLLTTAPSTFGEQQSAEKSYFDQGKKEVVCIEPLPVFTLGEKSSPSDKQVSELCGCIWSRFPNGGWEQKTSKLIRNKQDPGWRGTALISRFNEAFKECGGYKL